MNDKISEISDFNETAILALKQTNIADVKPVITVLKEMRRKIDALKDDIERMEQITQ